MQPTSKFGEVFQYSNLMAAAAGFIGASVVSPGKEPTIDGFEFVVAGKGGKRSLVLRDAQHEYAFEEAGKAAN